jgi:inositol transport system substrate-binding protein
MEEKMKKILLAGLLCLLVFSLVSCGGAKKAEEKKTFIAIMLVTAGGGDQFWTGINNAAMKRGARLEAEGMSYQILDGLNDANTQISQAEDLINRGVSAICLAPYDGASANTIIRLCKNANIPIVMFNRMADDMTDAFGFCGLSEKATAVAEMEALCKDLNFKGKIGQITGISGHSGAEARKAGIEEVAAKYPGIEILATLDGKFARENSMNITLDWLQAGMRPDAIVAPGSEMAIGVAMAIDEFGLKAGQDIKIMSFDATKEGIRMMLDGKTNWDAFQDPQVQVDGAVDLALKALAGNAKESIDIVGDLVTQENVKEFARKNYPDLL